jgi:hypothetical protein
VHTVVLVEAAMLATSHLSDVNSYDVAWASSVVTRAWKNVRDRFAAEGKREWVASDGDARRAEMPLRTEQVASFADICCAKHSTCGL